MPYLQIVVHVLHPPPSADSRQKGYPLPDFYSGATGNPAASVRDYCSGAYRQVEMTLPWPNFAHGDRVISAKPGGARGYWLHMSARAGGTPLVHRWLTIQ